MTSEMISVIVPIYKVEEYLDRCVNSLVHQTYQNLEIILVDDGSPDRCPEICDQWEQKDRRIRVIHKVNGGVSSARNAGMEAANGGWISFVDPDDYLAEDGLENLMAVCQRHKSDLVCGSIHGIKTRNRCDNLTLTDNILEKQSFAKQLHFLFNTVPSSSCAKLYNTSIIRKHALSFPLDTPWGEDAIFYCRYLTRASSIATIQQYIYHYDRTREGSAVKRYYENMNQLAQYQFNIQKECIQSITNMGLDFIREMEKNHFEACLNHYSLYETKREKLKQKIQEAASLFPEGANHEIYGKSVQQRAWLKTVWLWRCHHLKWYLKVVLLRFLSLFR